MEQAYLKNLQHFLSLSRKHIWIESHHHTPSDRRGVEVSDGCGLGWQRAEAGTPDDEGRGVAHRGSGPIQHLRGLLHGAPIYRVSKPSFLICKMDITIPLTQSCFLEDRDNASNTLPGIHERRCLMKSTFTFYHY